MRQEEQVRLIREALAAIDARRAPLAASVATNDPAAYTSAARAERERARLFGRRPLIVGFASQVREPGDYLTESLAPVPVLVVRTQAGVLRAFANVCRHRGAPVVAGCGRNAVRFTCPYHGWGYDQDGRLVSIPDAYGFDGVDPAAHGLVALPVEERHGLVWVAPAPAAAFDVATLLDGLDDDLASYGLARFVHQETRLVRTRMNWKLVSDTFWEAYHIHVLHKENVAPLFVRNLALFDPFGANHRLVGVRRSIENLRGRPEAEWDLLPHATILMNLFPNTVLVMQTDHAEVYRIFPSADRVDEAVTAVSLLVPEPGERWTRTMDLLLGVVAQDFALGEAIQRNFASGAIDHVTYGRFEAALAHFHDSIRRALGDAGP